jgi:methanethiol S-methyltransferase
VLVSWAYGYGSLPLGAFPGLPVLFVSTILGLGCLGVAVIIHRGFPEEHSKASDFAQLRTTGPYGYVRHPFYSSLIALNYFASLAFLSLYGIIASTMLLPGWWYLARSEEKDLVQEWGPEYVKYRNVTPMFLPRYRRKREDESGLNRTHS